MKKPYHGAVWLYWLGGGMGRRPADGRVELSVPTSNYNEDESFARYLIRTQQRCKGKKNLPRGTELYPYVWAKS